MRRFAIIAAIMLLVPAAFAACSGSGLAFSCPSGATPADVNTAISASSNGAVITFANGTYTWPSGGAVNFLTTKGTTLICATGATCTVNASGTAIGHPGWTVTSTNLYRISGFTFTGTVGFAAIWFCTAITCSGNLTQVRIDHNTFNLPSTGVTGIFLGDGNSATNIYGVIDHNVVSCTNNCSMVEMLATRNNSPPPNPLGTGNNMFVEDNTITWSTLTDSSAGKGCVDVSGTMSMVWRHNTTINCLTSTHGVRSAGGPSNFELYNNSMTINSGSSGSGFTDGFRLFHAQGAGTFMAFNNTLAAFSGHSGSAIQIIHYRDYPTNGTGSISSQCDGTVVDLPDGNRSPTGTYQGYPCWRQPGRDMAGNYSPMYIWNNFWSDTLTEVTLDAPDASGIFPPGGDYYPNHMQNNREWFNAVSASAQTSASSPFSGTTGMGFGTLARRPTTCTTSSEAAFGGAAGVGYFATDQGSQGTLYTCSATNTWTAYYTPYTYPHPLVGSGGASATQSPTIDSQDSSGSVSWTLNNGILGSSTFDTQTEVGSSSDVSNNLQGTGFGFSIPQFSSIDGVTVSFDALVSSTTTYTNQPITVQLLRGGLAVGTAKVVATNFTGSLATYTFGGSADLWGVSPSLTPLQVNDAGFGFEIKDAPTNGALVGRTQSVQHFRVTVNYTPSGGPAVTLTPSLAFGNQTVGTSSASRPATLTNSGSSTLTISSIAITGTDSTMFAQTNNCGASLGAGLSCTINVTFTPSSIGAKSASVSVTDNATGSPHTVALTGTGIQAAVSLNPSSLVFNLQTVGTTSTPQPVVLTNSGTANLAITGIATSGDYAQTNNCPGSLVPLASCTVNVTFTPSAQGPRTGTLTFTDNAPGSPHLVSLTGSAQNAVNNGISFSGGVTISGGIQFVLPSQEIFVYVSASTGNDLTGDGSLQNPVASPNRGEALVANHPNAHVILRDGTYYLSSALNLSAADSNTSYEAFPGESPIISGGKRITGWTNPSGNTWTASLNPTDFGNLPPESLFYNGQRRPLMILGATAGNLQGIWFRLQAVNCGGNPCEDRFTYSAADLTPASWTNLHIPAGNPCGQAASGNTYPTGNIEVAVHESFTQSIQRTNCVDTTNHIVYLTGSLSSADPSFFGYMNNARYQVLNVKTGTQQPGQWFLDQSVNPWVLTYIANLGELPNSDTVIMPRLAPPLVVVDSTVGLKVTGITFSHDNTVVPSTGYAAQQSDFQLQNALFKGRNNSNTTFNGVTFAHTNGHALWFLTDGTGTSSNITVENCAAYDLGAGGFYFGDFPPTSNDTEANEIQNVTVTNCKIRGYGRIYASSDAVDFLFGHHAIISYNDIADGFHDATGVCIPTQKLCTGGSSSNGIHDVEVHHNLVAHIGEGLNRDFGGIYMASYSGANNSIHDNIVHDINDGSANGDSAGTGANGIYVDNVSQDVQVYQNLVYNTTFSSLRSSRGPQVSGHPNVFDNNILAFSRAGFMHQALPAPTTSFLQYTFSHNLVYMDRDYTSSPASRVQQVCGPTDGTPTNSQNYVSNMYFNTKQGFGTSGYAQAFFTSTSSGGTCTSPSYMNFSTWQAAGEDASSVVQDPGFANPGNRDFTLSGSPGVSFSVFSLTDPGLSNSSLVPTVPSVFQPWPIAEFTNADF